MSNSNEAETLLMDKEVLQLKVENLEIKIENQRFKHEEAVRKMKAEHDVLKEANNNLIIENNDLKKTSKTLISQNEKFQVQLESKNAEKKIRETISVLSKLDEEERHKLTFEKGEGENDSAAGGQLEIEPSASDQPGCDSIPVKVNISEKQLIMEAPTSQQPVVCDSCPVKVKLSEKQLKMEASANDQPRCSSPVKVKLSEKQLKMEAPTDQPGCDYSPGNVNFSEKQLKMDALTSEQPKCSSPVKIKLSEKQEKLCEGIQKYVLRKRAATNLFKTYTSWFLWIQNICPQMTYGFDNFIFLKFHNTNGKLIYFAEYPEFPLKNTNEMVLPVIKEGWSSTNTKAYLLQSGDSKKSPTMVEVKTVSKEVIDNPEIGRYFSICVENRLKSYIQHPINFVVLVFVKCY